MYIKKRLIMGEVGGPKATKERSIPKNKKVLLESFIVYIRIG
jgi:hypothetical protein